MQVTTVPTPDPAIMSIMLLNILIFILIVVYAAYWLYKHGTTTSEQDESPKAQIAKIGPALLLILTVTAPISFNIYINPERAPIVYVMGLWWMSIGISFTDVMFDPTLLLAGIPFAIPKFAFIYMIHRYLLGETTRRRVLLIGIISETPIPILGLIADLLYLGGFVSITDIMIFIPIPLLLILGVLIVRFIPPLVKEKSWLEHVEAEE